MQAVRELGGRNRLSQSFVSEAVKSARIMREKCPQQHALYIGAAATALFLDSDDGQRLLERADAASRSLTQKAFEGFLDESCGTALEYGWAVIRKMHPHGPGPLKLWGRDAHRPPANSPGALLCHVLYY